MKNSLFLASACILACAGAAADEVTPERAVGAASAWFARSSTPDRLPTGDVRTFSMYGTNVFHLVALRGGGWAAMPADDDAPPLLAWTLDEDAEIPDSDDGCPGWSLMSSLAGVDVSPSGTDAAEGEEGVASAAGDRPRFSVSTAAVAPRRAKAGTSAAAPLPRSLTWEYLDSDSQGAAAWSARTKSGTPRIDGTAAATEIWVPALVKSRWGQGDANNKKCFNYHTPNNYVCGCVATAMAQLMRYYCWPRGVAIPLPGNEDKNYTISVASAKRTVKMVPGVLDWDQMPLRPASGITAEQGEMIGRVTYNCGVSLGMNYKSGGSSPGGGNGGNSTRGGLRDDFGYAGHGCYSAIKSTNIAKTLLPSFDAGRPASCNLPADKHQVVGDGYAFHAGALYIHLNMGWSGTSDAYYLMLDDHNSRCVASAHFNISTNKAVRIASGRVTDVSGNPVSGATVRATVQKSGSAAEVKTYTTNAQGIYAVETGKDSYSISIEIDGRESIPSVRTTSTSADEAGNSWGSDFVLTDVGTRCVWSGEAGDGNMNTPGNWEGNAVPGEGATVIFGSAAGGTIRNNIASFKPGAVVFTADCPATTLTGNAFSGVETFLSGGTARHVVNAAVSFADAIDVRGTEGGIDFAGGATGTYPAGNLVCRGRYNLTYSGQWTPRAGLRVPDGSVLTVAKFLGSPANSVVIDAGGEVVVTDSAWISGANGYLVKSNNGRFSCRGTISGEATAVSRFVSDETSAGVILASGLRTYGSADGKTKYMAPDLTYVIGQDGISGGNWMGYNNWHVRIRPSADCSITGTFTHYSTDSSNLNTLSLFTADYNDGSVARTVTVEGDGALTGSRLQVLARREGTLAIMNNKCTFGAGLLVTNTCTLKLGAGCRPGAGDVTLCKGTTLELPATYSAPVEIGGALKMSDQTGQSKVTLRFGGADENVVVPAGSYIIATTSGSIDTAFGDADMFRLANATAGNVPYKFILPSPNMLILTVGDSTQSGLYIWTGAAGDGKFSTDGNWESGAHPVAGSTIYLSSETDCTVTNDLDVAFGSVNFLYDDGVMTVCGNTLRATSLRNGARRHHVLKCPVVFDGEADVSLGADNYFVFEGGLTATSLANTGADAYIAGSVTLTEQNADWSTANRDFVHLVSGASLNLNRIYNCGSSDGPGANFDIAAGATLSIEGWMILHSDPDDEDHRRYIAYRNNGAVVFTGSGYVNGEYGYTSTGCAQIYPVQAGGTGFVAAKFMRNYAHSAKFMLDATNTVRAAWIVAAGGAGPITNGLDTAAIESLIGSGDESYGSFEVGEGSLGAVITPAAGDITMNAHVNVLAPLELSTSDTSGVARTVMVNGGIGGTGAVTVSGGGVLKLDYSPATIWEAVAHDPGTSFAVADTATLWVADGADPGMGSLSLGAGATLRVTAGETLALSGAFSSAGTETSPALIKLGDGSALAAGTYTVLTAAGGVAEGAAETLALVNPVATGLYPEFSVSGGSLILTVAAPDAGCYFWTGGAGNGNFSSPGNWSNNLAPTNGATLFLYSSVPATIHCDMSGLELESLTFAKGTALLTVDGAGSIASVSAVTNLAPTVGHKMRVPVEFKSGGEYAPIDVTGAVVFYGAGYAKGTVPVNHSTFYGNYNLTASEWNLDTPVTLAAGAVVSAPDTTVNETNASVAGMLNAEAGSSMTIKNLNRKTYKGDIFGTYAGDLTVTDNILFDTVSWYWLGENFTGTLRFGKLYSYTTSTGEFLRMLGNYRQIVVDGYGFSVRRGTVNLRDVQYGNCSGPLVIRSASNWKFGTEKPGVGTCHGYAIPGYGIEIDTTDWDDGTTPRTVTIELASGTSEMISGSGYISCFGGGMLSFKSSCSFTGGLTVSNSASVAVASGVTPGTGPVMLRDTAKLVVPTTLTLANEVSMDAGTSIVLNDLAVGRIPLEVGSLTLPASGTAKIKVQGAALENGIYPVLSVSGGMPENAAAKLVADVSAVSSETVTRLFAIGDTLFLSIGAPHNVWTGACVSNNRFSAGENWLDGSAPDPAYPLDFSCAMEDVTVSADFPESTVFPTAKFGAGVVVLNGTMHLSTLTNTTAGARVSVETGAKLWIDGDFVLDSSSVENVCMTWMNNGSVIVDGRVRSTGSARAHPSLYGTGTNYVGGIVCESTGDHFKLNSYNPDATAANWVVGAGGISGASGKKQFWIDRGDGDNDHGAGALLIAGADFAIESTIYARQPLSFDTADGRTITVNGKINYPPATADPSNDMTVSGTGRVVFNYATGSGSDAYTGHVTVNPGATAVLAPGSSPTTGGATAVSGSRLVFPSTSAAGATIGGAVTLEGGSSVSVTNLIDGATVLRVGSLAFDEGTDPVTYTIDGDAPLSDGVYTLLVADSALPSGVLDRISIVNNVGYADGVAVATNVVGSAVKITVSSADVWISSHCDGSEWTQNGGNLNFSNPDNWQRGIVPKGGSEVTIKTDGAATLVCDIANFQPSSVTFGSGSGLVTVNAANGGSISGLIAMTNKTANVHHVMNVPVAFADGVKPDVPLLASNYVDFRGGMTIYEFSTVANMYYFKGGTITVSKEQTVGAGDGAWTVASGTTLDMPNTTWHCHVGNLTVESGASMTVKNAMMNRADVAYLTEKVDGLFRVTDTFSAESTNEKWGYLVKDNTSAGTFAINRFYVKYVKSGKVYPCANLYGSQTALVLGEGGFERGASYYRFEDDKVQTFGVSADCRIALSDGSVDSGAKVMYNPNSGKGYTLNFDTTDFFDRSTPRTIIDEGQIGAKSPTYVRMGVGGRGTFVFANTKSSDGEIFSGGLVVSNTATVAVSAGSVPGRGTVAVRTDAGATEGAKLFLPDAGSGNVALAGDLSFDAGTSLVVSNLVMSATPMTAPSVTLPESGTVKIVVKGDSPLARGVYPVLAATAAISDAAAFAAKFTVDTTAVASPADAAQSVAIVHGNTLYISVGAPKNIWVGGTDADEDGRAEFSSPANWLDGALPVAGYPLDFSLLGAAASVNADIATEFPSIVNLSKTLTLSGTVNLATLTNAYNLAVASDAALNISGDFVLDTTGKTLLYSNNGTVTVGGHVKIEGATDGRVYVDSASAGVIIAGGVENNSTVEWFKINENSTAGSPVSRWVVGEDGFSAPEGSSYGFWLYNDKGSAVISGTEDFEFAAELGVNADMTFDTTRYGGSDGVIIRQTGIFSSDNAINVTGCGTYRVECDAFQGDRSGALNASGAATLELASGSHSGSGAVTVNSGATLSLPDAGVGVATVGGTLTMNGGSALAPGALVAEGSAAPLSVGSLAANGTVTVAIASGTRLAEGRYPILVSTADISSSVAACFEASVTEADPAFAEDMKYRIVADGKSLYFTVAYPEKWISSHCEGSAWTQNGGSLNFSDPANWVANRVPASGSEVIIGVDETSTLVCDIDGFDPKSITFPASSAQVVIAAGESSGSIANLESIVNSVAVHHAFDLPVAFAEGVAASIPVGESDYVSFPGGMTAATIAKVGANDALAYICGKLAVTNREDWKTSGKNRYVLVGDDSAAEPLTVLHLVNGMRNTGGANFVIQNGARVVVEGDLAYDADNTSDIFLANRNDGEFVVNGKIVMDPGCRKQLYPWYVDTSSGFVIADGLVSSRSDTDWTFRLSRKAGKTVRPKWIVGPSGITGAAKYWIYSDPNDSAHIQPYTNDFTISSWIGVRVGSIGLYLDTTGYGDGVGHTICASGAGPVDQGPMHVQGSGTYLCDFTPTKQSSYVAYNGAVTLSDTATLAVNAGKSPTQGAVTLAVGNTLLLTQAGAETASIGGKLTMAGGSTLAYSNLTATAAALSVGSFATSGSGKVKIVIKGEGRLADATDFTLLSSTADLPAALKSKEDLTGAFDVEFETPSYDGTRFTLSSDDKNIYLRLRWPHVWVASHCDGSEWTSGGGNLNFSNPDNWISGSVPDTSADSDIYVILGTDAAATLVCDIDGFNPARIIFPEGSAAIAVTNTVAGETLVVGGDVFNGSETTEQKLNLPVEFRNGGDLAAIDVSGGPVGFWGGVTGTLPVNHSKFYGSYSLTAATWDVPDPITIAADSTVSAPETTLRRTATDTIGVLCSETGGRLVLANLEHKTSKGNIFGSFAGTLDVGQVTLDSVKWYGINANMTGTMKAGYIYAYSSEGDYVRFHSDGEFVIGRQTGKSGITARRGTFNLRETSAEKPLVLRSAADWSLTSEKPGAGTGNGFRIDAQGVEFDTGDFEDPAVPRKITVAKSGSPASVLDGPGYVSCFGRGTFRFDTSCTFTGGLTASNGVSLVLADGVAPGAGAVTVRDTAKMVLEGTATVSGALTLDAGSTLVVSNLSSTAKMSVASLALPSEGRVNLVVGGTAALERGLYPVLTVSGDLAQGVALADRFAVDASAVSDGAVCSVAVHGSVLYLSVGAPKNIWVGGTDANGDGKQEFSSGANWLDGEAPVADYPLDFRFATETTRVDADVETVFPTLFYGAGLLKLDGALHLQTLTNTTEATRMDINSGATLEIDGDLVLSNNTGSVVYMTGANNGCVVVGGLVRVEGSAKGYPSWNGSGTNFVSGVVCNSTSDHFKLNSNQKNAPAANWVIGADGLSSGQGKKSFWIDRGDGNNKHGTGALLVAAADFEIAAPIGVRQPLTIVTSDLSGNPRTVTAGPGGFLFSSAASGTSNTVTISGGGTFTAGYMRTSGYDAFAGGVVVEAGAKLAVENGANLDSAAITVRSGATLYLPEAGTGATAAGALTLASGANLVVSNPVAGVSPIKVKSLSATATVNLSVLGDERLADGVAYTLVETTDAMAQDASAGFGLSVGTPAWEGTAYALSVDGRKLVITATMPDMWVPSHYDGSAEWSGDLKFSTPGNWVAGRIPSSGADVVIGPQADANLVCDIPGFAPKSVTFPSGTGLVTVGAADGGSILGVESIVNSVDQHHVFNVPVTFATNGMDDVTADFAADITMSEKRYMDFAGGLCADYVKKTGADAYYCGRVSLNATENWATGGDGKDVSLVIGGSTVLTLPSCSINSETDKIYNFNVRPGAALHVLGDMTINTPGNTQRTKFLVLKNYGIVQVDGMVYVTGKTKLYPCSNASSGTFVLHGVQCDSTGDYMQMHSDHDDFSCIYRIGSGGLCGTKGFWIPKGPSGRTVTIKADEDFAVNAYIGMGSKSKVIFDTTGADGSGKTVTVAANIASNDGNGGVTVKGSGTNVFNYAAMFTNGLTVETGATVAVKPGCKPGAKAVTVRNGARFVVTESGEVDCSGGVFTAESGSTLEFAFTDVDSAPTLKISGPTMTKTMNVVISGVRPDRGDWILVSGLRGATTVGDFAATGVPDWGTLKVDSYKLYLTAASDWPEAWNDHVLPSGDILDRWDVWKVGQDATAEGAEDAFLLGIPADAADKTLYMSAIDIAEPGASGARTVRIETNRLLGKANGVVCITYRRYPGGDILKKRITSFDGDVSEFEIPAASGEGGSEVFRISIEYIDPE